MSTSQQESAGLRRRANQSAASQSGAANTANQQLEDDGKIQMKIGYPPQEAAIAINKVKSRMGRATESHFAVLNTKIIQRKQTSRSFDPSKVLNPALRATIKEEDDTKTAEFLKVKALFMGEEAKKRLAYQQQSKDGLLMQKALASQVSQNDLNNASQADLQTQNGLRASQETAAKLNESPSKTMLAKQKTLAPDKATKDTKSQKQGGGDGGQKSTLNSNGTTPRPSFTFLSKKRAPYSYIKPDEAPPVALYRPKFGATDRDLRNTHIDARLGDAVDKRQSFKPKPACVIVGNDKCSLEARQQVSALNMQHRGTTVTQPSLANNIKKRPTTANVTRGDKLSFGAKLNNADSKEDHGTMFMTAVIPEEPVSAMLGTHGQEPMSAALRPGQDNQELNYEQRLLAARTMAIMRPGESWKRKRRESSPQPPAKGLSFDRMTSRALMKVDEEIRVKSPNVFNGNQALRGISLNEKRFDIIDKTPGASSKTKNTELPKWGLISQRSIDFRHKVYNRNVYKPKTAMVTRRYEIGNNEMNKNIGRDEQPRGDYCLAQFGAGAHLDQLEQSTVEGKTKRLAQYNTASIVSMDQQKPRDNSMYHLSDRTNLKQQDKALVSFTSKFGVFSHKMLTKSEVKQSKQHRFKKERTQRSVNSKEDTISEIWLSFTVPLKFRIPSRRGNQSSKGKRLRSRPLHQDNLQT